MDADGRLHARRPPCGGGGALDNALAAVDAVAIPVSLQLLGGGGGGGGCGADAAAGFDARDSAEAGAVARLQRVGIPGATGTTGARACCRLALRRSRHQAVHETGEETLRKHLEGGGAREHDGELNLDLGPDDDVGEVPCWVCRGGYIVSLFVSPGRGCEEGKTGAAYLATAARRIGKFAWAGRC